MTDRELAALLAANPDIAVTPDALRPAVAQQQQTSEHDEQAALFAWAEANEAAHPELAMLFAIPNGGARHPATAGRLKAEGVKAGVPDMFLAVRRGRFGGLFVELKRKPNKPTVQQQAWIERLRYYGYAAVVCYGAAEAQQAIMAYLQQES